MEDDKNIRLTIVKPEENQDDAVEIDLAVVVDFGRRLFSVWLAVSLAVGAVLGGLGIALRDALSTKDAVAVINYSGGSSQLTTRTPDLEKLASASVVGRALGGLNISLEEMDNIRTHLRIESIIPNAVMDERTLYYKIFSGAGGDIAGAAEKLLNTEYQSTRYAVHFDYHGAGHTREEGLEILNALIAAYRQYFMDTYTNRPLLGSMTNVIDYQDYDFPEAAVLFSDLLQSIQSFLRQYAGSSFRSSITGYSVSDLIRLVSNVKDAELDRISAYIQMNSVLKGGVDDAIARYGWLIERGNEDIAIQNGRFQALTAAIENYKKDPLLYVVTDMGAAQGPGGELNGAYDDLISQLIETENSITSLEKTNQLYQSMIDRLLERNSEIEPSDIERVERDLSDLSVQIQDLMALVNTTMDDYFSTTLSSLFQVQMPALAEAPETISPMLVKTVLIAEALVFVVFCGAAFALTMGQTRKEAEAKKRENNGG